MARTGTQRRTPYRRSIESDSGETETGPGQDDELGQHQLQGEADNAGNHQGKSDPVKRGERHVLRQCEVCIQG